jgi:hypothetical protein
VSEHTIPDIEPLLKRLSLANTRRTYRELIRRAEGESWTYGQFLQTVASEEIAHWELRPKPAGRYDLNLPPIPG